MLSARWYKCAKPAYCFIALYFVVCRLPRLIYYMVRTIARKFNHLDALIRMLTYSAWDDIQVTGHPPSYPGTRRVHPAAKLS